MRKPRLIAIALMCVGVVLATAVPPASSAPVVPGGAAKPPLSGLPDRQLVVSLTLDERRVVPIGIDNGADWGDVIIESGTAQAPGLTEGTFLRRGIAYTGHLGAQDTVQITFAEGSLVFQATGEFWGPTEAGLLGGTGQFRGMRGAAVITSGEGTQQWAITLLGKTRVDLSSPATETYLRELVSTERIMLASSGSTVGNMTLTKGRLVDDSELVADYTASSIVVQDLAGSLERRAVQAMFEFADGTLFVNSMIVADATQLPTKPTAYVISGGTGRFTGASGYAEYQPPSTWTFTTFAQQGAATPVKPTLRGPQEQTRYTRILTSKTASGGVGDLVLAGGWTRTAGADRGHYNVSAQSVARADARQTLLSFMQYSWGASDRLLVLGLAQTGTSDGPVASVERAVIGGLGAYVGYSGSVSLTPVSSGKWRTTYQLMR